MRLPFSPQAERLGLMLLALLMLGAGLGWRLPLSIDEERFLGVALEMLQSGAWLIPHRAAEVYGDKPPLFMWLVAGFIQLTGSAKIALFLPALIAGITTTACLHDLGRRLWNRRIGVIAALLFLASYQTLSILRAGQIDGFLCLWIGLGLYGMARHLLLGPAWGWFYVSCAAMGLGIISKGVGFLPLLMLVPYGYAVRKGWPGVVAMPHQARRWLFGALVLLAAVCVWLLPLLVDVLSGDGAEGVAYLHDILLHQTAQRYANAWEHKEPFWYFFVDVIPKYWLPLVVLLPWWVPAWRRQLLKRDGRVLVLLGWVVLVVLFFCLSSGKRKLYIFPALPALALVGAQLMPWLMQRWRRRLGRVARARAQLIGRVVVAGWFGLWFARGYVEPFIDGPNPHAKVMLQAAELSAGADLVLADWRESEWLFARQPIIHFGFMGGSSPAKAVRWLREHPTAFAMIPVGAIDTCFQRSKAQLLGAPKDDQWYLVGISADNGLCRAEAPARTYRFSWGAQAISALQ